MSQLHNKNKRITHYIGLVAVVLFGMMSTLGSGGGGGDAGGTPPPTTFNLSITTDGTGTGTVTSSPTGIDCGTDCSEDYAENTVIILSASPATDSLFVGWSGACSGTGNCSVTMDATKSVTATFNLQQPAITANCIWAPSGGIDTTWNNCNWQ